MCLIQVQSDIIETDSICKCQTWKIQTFMLEYQFVDHGSKVLSAMVLFIIIIFLSQFSQYSVGLLTLHYRQGFKCILTISF